MKEIKIKKISCGLLGFIGVQACAVSVSLAKHYSQSQVAPIVLTIEAPKYAMRDILYGAITKPQLNYSVESSRSHAKELGITFIASTTGISTGCTFVIPV